MKGSTGTSTLLGRTRIRRMPVDDIIKAQMLLRCVRSQMDSSQVSICELVANRPLDASHQQRRAVYAIWLKFAEAGLLVGATKASREKADIPWTYCPRDKAEAGGAA